jgi:hypothetical protein
LVRNRGYVHYNLSVAAKRALRTVIMGVVITVVMVVLAGGVIVGARILKRRSAEQRDHDQVEIQIADVTSRLLDAREAGAQHAQIALNVLDSANHALARAIRSDSLKDWAQARAELDKAGTEASKACSLATEAEIFARKDYTEALKWIADARQAGAASAAQSESQRWISACDLYTRLSESKKWDSASAVAMSAMNYAKLALHKCHADTSTVGDSVISSGGQKTQQ